MNFNFLPFKISFDKMLIILKKKMTLYNTVGVERITAIHVLNLNLMIIYHKSLYNTKIILNGGSLSTYINTHIS